MLILGFSGGLDRDHEDAFDLPHDFAHDSAAVLVRDGEVVAAIEQERLNRIKHTNKAAGPAIRFCLHHAGVTVDRIDAVAYYAAEAYADRLLRETRLVHPSAPPLDSARAMVQRVVADACGQSIDPSRICFVSHHWAHAVSTYFMSGFDEALVVTLDGQGEGVSGTIFDGRGQELSLLRSVSEPHSLGFFYRDVIRFLGYDMFDEYKVMGLAPYGDPERFRRICGALYDLLPDGGYRLHLERVPELSHYVTPRVRGARFDREHLDLAAALQEALETIGSHVIQHFADETGHRQLCLAGGVAHNCSLNGRLAYAGLFDQLFVQPASHDAGCALGAALAAQIDRQRDDPVAPLRHVSWGSDLPSDEQLARTLDGWASFLTVERPADVCTEGARLMAAGKVIGWVQGRSEFGPRALGHRSILADPRPAEHKDTINRMVKKREAYRPFAPSVLEEHAGDYFVLPGKQRRFPYMTVVLQVHPDKRDLLGAVTHVDGTARVQTVNRGVNERYWRLIDEFRTLTGVPMVLNTSFNNHAEPIVDSVNDAIVCFLTTDLDALVVGDCLVQKRWGAPERILDLCVSVPPTVSIRAVTRSGPEGPTSRHELGWTHRGGRFATISPTIHAALTRADGTRTMRSLLAEVPDSETQKPDSVVTELQELWSSRLVVLGPAS